MASPVLLDTARVGSEVVSDEDPADDIFRAAARGDLNSVLFFLKESEGALVEVEHPAGGTPLHFATANGREAVVELLLTWGAQADAVDRSCGATPLHFAILGGFVAIGTRLLDAGADGSAVTFLGMTPRRMARMYGCASLSARLR